MFNVFKLVLLLFPSLSIIVKKEREKRKKKNSEKMERRRRKKEKNIQRDENTMDDFWFIRYRRGTCSRWPENVPLSLLARSLNWNFHGATPLPTLLSLPPFLSLNPQIQFHYYRKLSLDVYHSMEGKRNLSRILLLLYNRLRSVIAART